MMDKELQPLYESLFPTEGPYVTKKEAIDVLKSGLELSAKKIAELENWKKEAKQVFEKLNLQEIGKEIGLPLGKEISPEVLPYIKRIKNQIEELKNEEPRRYCPKCDTYFD